MWRRYWRSWARTISSPPRTMRPTRHRMRPSDGSLNGSPALRVRRAAPGLPAVHCRCLPAAVACLPACLPLPPAAAAHDAPALPAPPLPPVSSLTAARTLPAGLELLRLHESMVRIEAFEKKAQEIYRAGWLPGALHLYLGEEAIAAAVCSRLRSTDMVTSTHRGHGHAVAKAFFALESHNLRQHTTDLIAELAGRNSGVSRGRGGSMHFYDQTRTGLLGTNGFVGGGIGLAVGCAMSAKVRGTDDVAVSFFGDGATSHQSFHENLNLATTLKIPVVFICENSKQRQVVRHALLLPFLTRQ